MIELLINIIGSTLSAFSWIPQIIKMVETHDVSGFDIKAYLCSIAASFIFLTYAIVTHGWMLGFFAGVNFALGITETFLIYWYGVVNKMDRQDPDIIEVGEEILHDIKKKHKKYMFRFIKRGYTIYSPKRRRSISEKTYNQV